MNERRLLEPKTVSPLGGCVVVRSVTLGLVVAVVHAPAVAAAAFLVAAAGSLLTRCCWCTVSWCFLPPLFQFAERFPKRAEAYESKSGQTSHRKSDMLRSTC